jgi:hypothetical protein
MTEWDWAGLIDWEQAFSGDAEPEVPWLFEPFLEQGTLNALYGGMKVGKSLLIQDIGAQLARSVHVLYLDFENNQPLIVERYQAMGRAPQDLARLHYASYPQLPNLDTPEGGEQACLLALHTQAALVVIDTTSRIVGGAENSADTYADLYKHTLMRLKRAGHTVLRIDHEGKDPDRGQRGSSAKGADVDVLWHLTDESGGVLRLDPELNRPHHAAPFRVRRHTDPLRHEVVRTALAAGQMDLAWALDQLGVPAGASRKICRAALSANGMTARTDDLAIVVRHRKTGGTAGGTAPSGLSHGSGLGQLGQTRADLVGQQLGQTGQPTWDKSPL